MLLLLCNKPLLFDSFLAASAFWGNALFDFLQNSWNWHLCRISFFLPEFNKPKMVLECQTGAGDLNVLHMEVQGKYQTGNSEMTLHLSLFLPSQSSSFSSSSSSEPSLFSSLHTIFLFFKASVFWGFHTKQSGCGTLGNHVRVFVEQKTPNYCVFSATVATQQKRTLK